MEKPTQSQTIESEPNSALALAHMDTPATDGSMRVAVIADPHVAEPGSQPQRHHSSVIRLRAALNDAEARGVDAVVSVGDLTKDGAISEYELFDECLDRLTVPFVAVPGNHDVKKATDDSDAKVPPLSRFVQRYTPGELPYHERIGPLDVIGLNTASTPDGRLADTHDGAVSSEQVRWLDEELSRTETPVVVMHHNTPAMYDQLRSYADSTGRDMDLEVLPVLRDPDPLIDTLRRHKVGLVLSGHLHVPGAAGFGGVRELNVPSTGAYPQGYAVLDFEPAGTTVRYVPVSRVNAMTEAYTTRDTAGELESGLAAFASIRLASAPLINDQTDQD